MLSWSAEGIMLQSDCAKLAKADDSALLLLGLSMEADSPAVSLAKAGGDPPCPNGKYFSTSSVAVPSPLFGELRH